MGSIMGRGVWMCVVNVNPAVDWPPLLHMLHTLTNRDYSLAQDDYWVARTCHMTLTSV